MQGTLCPLPRWGKVSLPGVSEAVLSASASPLYPGPVPAPAAPPYLGRGGGQPSCFSFALSLGPWLLATFAVVGTVQGEAFGHTFWVQWPVIFVVQVRKLKAENGSRGGQRPSPGASSAFSLQAWGPPWRSRMGAPRLAAQVQRCPSTTTHCSCRAATSQPSGGSRRPPHIPWWGSMPWALGADLASARPGLSSWLLARAGCVHCTAVGQRERPSLAGVWEESRGSRGARGGPLGADKAPSLPASPGGLEQEAPALVDLEHFIRFGKVTC